MPNDMNEHVPRVTIPLYEHNELLKVKAKYERLCEALLRRYEAAPMCPSEWDDFEAINKSMSEILGQLKEYNPDRYDRMYKKELERIQKLWTS